jgi:hypothetical protein
MRSKSSFKGSTQGIIMLRSALGLLFACITGLSLAQGQAPRPLLPAASQPGSPSATRLPNPQIRHVPTTPSATVFQRPTTLAPVYPWGSEPQSVTPSGAPSPWRMTVQTPNWNPMLPAVWNPNPPPANLGIAQTGWTANPQTTLNTMASPGLTGLNLNDRSRLNPRVFGVNPLPVLFP